MKYRFLLFISPLLFLSAVFAQDKTYKNEVGFQSDNDGFLAMRSDRYYTAGNFFYFYHALKINDTSSKVINRVLTFELGQKIFTPQTGAIPDPIYIDRPFAGYLYVGSNLNLIYKNESSLKLQLRVGMVGPDAYGEQIQDLIHSTFGFYRPEGWQYQIQNAFQVNGSVEYNRLLTRGKTTDISFNSYGNLGTGITGAGLGLMLRVGTFNQFYNSASTTSTVSDNPNIKPLHNSELFFYYKPVLNIVAYDATIQGGLFESSPGFNEVESTPNLFVFSQQVGGSYVKGHWVINLSGIFETRETKEMVKVHWGHQWGVINAEYRF
jgi:lipid A 3-O-deacylase